MAFVGGFENSNPKFPYTNPKTGKPQNPNLSAIEFNPNVTDINQKYIDQLQRQQHARWPEFSWCRDYKNKNKAAREETRLFQMFRPNISRIGYDVQGQSFAIICPQQGAYAAKFGAFNVEVTVTSQRGWVNEDTKRLAADITVRPKIWFTEGAEAIPAVKELFDKMEEAAVEGWKFPFTKADALELHTSADDGTAWVPVRDGLSDQFDPPPFTLHHDEAFQVYNLAIKIGNPIDSGNAAVNAFNKTLMIFFNAANSNMLGPGNTLTWNLWASAPEIVDKEEWLAHAKLWRESIETGVPIPGPSSPFDYPRTRDGEKYEPSPERYLEALENLQNFETVVAGCCACCCVWCK